MPSPTSILFDDELSPRHQRELERIFGEDVRVVDRTALILDIFALHARTREGALQVELAQYEYRLPRLTRAWTHLARQAGGGAGRSGAVGGVGLRGPGETQLEVDRREIARRIANLRRELDKVRSHRGRYRAQRKRAAIPTVAIVGYTNAGKSTLLNRLSGADVFVADQLFATLDPTTRRIELPGGREILLSDTVGLHPEAAHDARGRLPRHAGGDPRGRPAAARCRHHPSQLPGAGAGGPADPRRARGRRPSGGDGPQQDRSARRPAHRPWTGWTTSSAPSRSRRSPASGFPSLRAALEQELLEGMAPIDVLLPYDQGTDDQPVPRTRCCRGGGAPAQRRSHARADPETAAVRLRALTRSAARQRRKVGPQTESE